MIRYYLNEEPLLKNIPTYQLNNPDEQKHVLENINKMVVKKTNELGGYGMLMGHTASDEEITLYKDEIKKDPRQFIAQPLGTFTQSKPHLELTIDSQLSVVTSPRICLMIVVLWLSNGNCLKN